MPDPHLPSASSASIACPSHCANPKCVSSVKWNNALQKWLAYQPHIRNGKIIQWTSDCVSDRWTIRLSDSKRCPCAYERAKRPTGQSNSCGGGVTCCTSHHCRLRVETMVGSLRALDLRTFTHDDAFFFYGKYSVRYDFFFKIYFRIGCSKQDSIVMFTHMLLFFDGGYSTPFHSLFFYLYVSDVMNMCYCDAKYDSNALKWKINRFFK